MKCKNCGHEIEEDEIIIVDGPDDDETHEECEYCLNE
jgi:hypothetical protein